MSCCRMLVYLIPNGASDNCLFVLRCCPCCQGAKAVGSSASNQSNQPRGLGWFVPTKAGLRRPEEEAGCRYWWTDYRSCKLEFINRGRRPTRSCQIPRSNQHGTEPQYDDRQASGASDKFISLAGEESRWVSQQVPCSELPHVVDCSVY
jgi:hypothetical protein